MNSPDYLELKRKLDLLIATWTTITKNGVLYQMPSEVSKRLEMCAEELQMVLDGKLF